MRWNFAEGLLGSGHQTLAPSRLAQGPNQYLGRTDFFKMLGIACAAHFLFFIVASLFPQEKVTNIPVRALSFKLGDQDRIAAIGAPVSRVPATVAAPVMHASSNARVAPKASIAAKPIPVKPQKIPQIARPDPTPAPTPTPQPVLTPLPPVTAPVAASVPAIAPAPQQYVREVGQATAMPNGLPSTSALTGDTNGAASGTAAESAQTSEAIRLRYEQQISGWIERHKLYPPEANGQQGRVVVRMRIDRSGVVRYYALEQSSGNAAIDAAAIDMIRRANPVPAVPANYPASSLVEFLIPITFHAPQ